MTEQELEKLYNDAYKSVYWTAISLLKNKEEAEDVVQDTFITAYNSYDSLKDKAKAIGWVKKIAANKCLNILTRTRTFNADDEFFDDTEAVGEDFLPESMVETAEKRKIIMDIINNTLSEETAMTIILFYFDEMSIKEIAEKLNIPQGTVLSRLNYAKKKIKKEVEKYEKDNKDKLFVGVPFLTLLFEKEAEQIPFKPMPASLLSMAASTKAAAGTSAATAAKTTATATVIKGAAIGVAAVIAIGGAGLFAYKKLATKNERSKSKSKTRETITETVEITETEKTINSKGMTPDQLNLQSGYVSYETYHDSNGDEKRDQQYFDADGNMVLDCVYNENGEMTHSDYFIYEGGKLTREELWDYSEEQYGRFKDYTYGPYGIERVDTGYLYMNIGEVDKYFVYEYDDLGRLIKVTRYSNESDKVFWYSDYIYNDDGSYLEKVTSWDMLSQQMKESGESRLYDADGKLIEEKTGFMNEKKVYTYDDNGNILTVENYSGTKLDFTLTYEYDSEGRLVRKVAVNNSGVQIFEYTYDIEEL